MKKLFEKTVKSGFLSVSLSTQSLSHTFTFQKTGRFLHMLSIFPFLRQTKISHYLTIALAVASPSVLKSIPTDHDTTQCSLNMLGFLDFQPAWITWSKIGNQCPLYLLVTNDGNLIQILKSVICSKKLLYSGEEEFHLPVIGT